MSSKAAWSTRVPGQPELQHSGTLSQKPEQNKQNTFPNPLGSLVKVIARFSLHVSTQMFLKTC